MRVIIHPRFVRITHWLNAIAIVCMASSGWAIYNASPIFPFSFPARLTLGGWLGGAIAWHLAVMWLLVTNGLVYLACALASGHLRRRLLPLHPRAILRDGALALRFRLSHDSGEYNAVQRLLYVGVLLVGVVVVLSGLAIWKPVQLQWLTALMGGYDRARVVHFVAMAAIVAFVVVHFVLVFMFPRTLVSMVTGRDTHRSAHQS